MTESQKLFNDIGPLLEGMGLQLVAMDVSRHKGSTQIKAVVYRAGGTGIADCSKTHRLIESRVLDVLGLGEDDYSLEVSSPGTDRVFRSNSEYSVFKGRGVRLFLDDGTEACGRIASSDELAVVVSTAEGEESFPLSRITKCKLDYSQEGR